MKRRLLCLLLAVIMVCCLLPTGALAGDNTAISATGAPGRVFAALKDSPYTFAGGSGTMADPYLISTPDQLNAIRKGLDKHYKLTCDIDLSSWGDWLPIGDEVLNSYGVPAPFTGSFDGAGHVISGMRIVGTRADFQPAGQREGHATRYFGLFAYVKSRNTAIKPGDAYEDTTLGGVYNLGVVNYTINISAVDTDINDQRIGAVAGVTENTRIVGCWSAGGTAETNEDLIGGLVGDASNTAIRECWNSSTITGVNVGGIACHLSNVWISHCFNAGTLKGGKSGTVSGIGTAWYSKGNDKKSVNGIMYCYNSGSLSGETVVGVGKADFLDNIYNAGTLVGESVNPVSIGSPKLGITHNGERYLKDENWTDSASLGRKVLVALREDELVSGGTSSTGVGSFTDVQTTDYFADAVIWALGRNITRGTTNTTFSPQNTCTKDQGITFVYRTELEPSYWGFSSAERATFLKVNPDWFDSFFYASAQWAFDEGMITPTTYLKDPCTRGDFVTYLWKAAGSPRTQTSNKFTDVPSNAAYAQAVAWAIKQGVTNGTTDTTFSPNDTCTRGQIVTFLYRAYKNA